MRKADVIIPTFKPGDKLEKLLRRLLEQSVPVGRVIIMNTEESTGMLSGLSPYLRGKIRS